MRIKIILCLCLWSANFVHSADIRFETARQYEEYFERELIEKRPLNFSEMEGQVRDYLRILVKEDKTNQITVTIAKATHRLPSSIRGYVYGEEDPVLCVSLASYINSKTYRRLSDIVDELNEKAMATREPTWFERLAATLSGYMSLSTASVSGGLATAEAPRATSVAPGCLPATPKSIKVS